MKDESNFYAGIGVSKGYAAGTAYVLETEKISSCPDGTGDPDKEAARLNQAVSLAEEQIRELAAATQKKLGEKNAEILESHLNYLEDPAFVGEASEKIRREHLTAEEAVSEVTQALFQTFSAMDDDYIRERADDIRDIGARLLRILSGKSQVDFASLQPGTILFAHDLKPSDTARIDRHKISACVTETGGGTSHTAILANAIGIAAVVGCQGILADVHTGDSVIVDGISGSVILRPDKAALQKYRVLSDDFERERISMAENAGKIIRNKDGKQILVAANIGSLNDLETALENGADGVGLFRTEFLYMNRDSLPSEEEQYRIYRKAAERLEGRPLTIRTLDIGGDKSLPYLEMPREENPFLGLRAIRLCLKHPDIFRTQLCAILRAAAYGDVRIMFPMISAVRELNEAKKIFESCRNELKRRGIPCAGIRVGMMVEIPSAALAADEFAKQVDFFSIGTNDLTQYTLAADRMNEGIAEYYNPMNPSVMRLIRMTIEAAHRASIPCCMCGELAGDENAASALLAYGLDEFSVSPGKIVETKTVLQNKI